MNSNRIRLTRLTFLKWWFALGVGLLAALPATAGEVLPGRAQLAAFLEASPEAVAVVMVSTPGCPICEIVRREQLLPLQRDSNFADIAVFEVLMQDDHAQLLLFNTQSQPGKIARMSPKRLAASLNIRLAPTLLFLNQRRQLAEPLVGYASADFYWSYLNERLDTARRNAGTSR